MYDQVSSQTCNRSCTGSAPGVAGGVCTVTCKGLGYLWIMQLFNEVTGAALTAKGSLFVTHEDPLKRDLLKISQCVRSVGS
jgi:hypothetical protein